MKRQRQGGFLVAKIHHLSGRILAKKLKKYHIDEINPAQGRILFVLWRNDNISIQELAKRTQLEKSTLTSMLDRLQEMGYLVRVPSKKDRRRIFIKLTKKDKSLHNIYAEISQEMNSLFYNGFSIKEIDKFENNLKVILNNLITFEVKK